MIRAKTQELDVRVPLVNKKGRKMRSTIQKKLILSEESVPNT